MFLTMFGTVVIAGIVGYLSEKTGWTHNGILQSIIICVGGAFVFFFVRLMFNILRREYFGPKRGSGSRSDLGRCALVDRQMPTQRQ